MFERILVQQHRPDPTEEPLDLGALVEAMVFYGRTDLILTPGVLSQMGRAWGVWLGWIAGHIHGDGPYHEPPLRFIAAPSGAELFRNGPGGSTVWVTEFRHTEAPTRVYRWSIRSFWRSQGAGVAHSAIPWVGWKPQSTVLWTVLCRD